MVHSCSSIRLDATPRTFNAVVEYESRRIFPREHVTALVDAAKSYRDKALITFLVQSGQRVGLVTNLVRRHVPLDDEPPIVVDVPSMLRDGRNVNKGTRPYEFAVGTDTLRYLQLMLREGAMASMLSFESSH